MNHQSIELTVQEAASVLDCTTRTIRNRCQSRRYARSRRTQFNGVSQWLIPLSDLKLTPTREIAYLQSRGMLPMKSERSDAETGDDICALDSLTESQRRVVAERKQLVDKFTKLPAAEWDKHLRGVSRATVYRLIKSYRRQGLAGLAPRWGNRKGDTVVPEAAREVFASIALNDSEPAYTDTWLLVKGYMARMHPGVKIPSVHAFVRWFHNAYPRHYRDLRRKGYEYYKRNHEYYIPRNVDDIPAGKGWYSDHHQLDTIVSHDGKQMRPWATVWRDIRSGKILSCYIHVEAPNSDHVFYAFYLAARDYGLPDFIYIDNGKDYRVRDFAGQTRRNCSHEQAFEMQARSLMGLLSIDVVFATPYNAQAKSIERDFKTVISQFAKFMAGYTGSHPAKRPRSTTLQCAAGELLSLEECNNLLQTYLRDTFNQQPRRRSRHLKGLSPDQAFAKYRKDLRTVSAESLKLCMMRTSKAHKIDRNGINDTELGIRLRYWAEWMLAVKGTMVYMRRDIKDYGVAWVWDNETGAFLGKAALVDSISLRADTPLEKEALKRELARKRADAKAAREATRTSVRFTARELIESMAAGVSAESPQPPLDSMGVPVNYHVTEMDHAAAQHERDKKTGTYDLSAAVPRAPQKRKLRLFECDE